MLFRSAFYQREDNLSDYGIPYVPATVTDPAFTPYIGGPAPVDFDNYYGLLNRDFEDVDVARFTARFEHDFNDSITFRNQTRIGQVHRNSIAGAPRFSATNPAVINRGFQPRDDRNDVFVNQSDFLIDFETGALKHEALVGIEVAKEDYFRRMMAAVAPALPADPYNPNPVDGSSTGFNYTGASNTADALTLSAYAFDTVEVTEWLDLTGGIRFDQYDLKYVVRDTSGVVTSALERTDETFSNRAAAVVKPAENGSIYFGYGTSFNPSAETQSLTAANVNVDPEETNTMELGTKWDVLDERLSLSAALFRINKSNARSTDTITNEVTLDGSQRVDGFELGAAGEVNDWLNVYLSYTHLDATLTGATANASPAELANIGNNLANTPEDSFSLWFQAELPNNFFVGGGPVYVSDRFTNVNNTTVAPSYLIWDALVGYRVNEKLTLRMNLNNIADENYVGTVGGGHFIPGEGRSVMFSASMEF